MTEEQDKMRLRCYECEHEFWDTSKKARKETDTGVKIVCPKCGNKEFTLVEEY